MLQLLPAPPPPPDYCLLWADRWFSIGDPWWLCMQKAEWSGWAQAVGAIVALALAIGLPARARQQARQDAKETIIAFMAQLMLTLEEVRDSCAEHDWQTFQAKRLLLQDAAHAGDFLFGTPVNGHIRGIALGLRSTSLEAFHASSAHGQLGNWPHWHARFHGMAVGARSLLEEVRALRP